MLRLRLWSALGVLLIPSLLLLSAVRGNEPPGKEKQSDDKTPEKWLVDRTLTVSPARAPMPVFKYRLYPQAMERVEGNAVPIYLRFAHERNDERRKALSDKPSEWNELPLDKMPMAEAKEFLKGYAYNLKQLDIGARRKAADWNYTLDAGNPVGILLPDAQEMRRHAPILVLKARVEILEGRYADAIRTLETGFSFSQQISNGPFLISSLVGVACASLFSDCLLEMVQRPDAPNLYWALAVIPRPLIDLRNPNEYEQAILEMQFPDLADLSRPRTAEEWDAGLKRTRLIYRDVFSGETDEERQKRVKDPAEPASKSPDLPIAKKYLVDVAGIAAAKIEAMAPAQILLLYLSHSYREICDETFKATYLPYTHFRELQLEAEKRLKSLPDTEACRIAKDFLPSVLKVRHSQMRLERKLAALMAIEALRMHAAAKGGQLPDKLDQVKVVPVPLDPGSGKPFEYVRDGSSFTLSSQLPGESLAIAGLRYQVTLRK